MSTTAQEGAGSISTAQEDFSPVEEVREAHEDIKTQRKEKIEQHMFDCPARSAAGYCGLRGDYAICSYAHADKCVMLHWSEGI